MCLKFDPDAHRAVTSDQIKRSYELAGYTSDPSKFSHRLKEALNDDVKMEDLKRQL